MTLSGVLVENLLDIVKLNGLSELARRLGDVRLGLDAADLLRRRSDSSVNLSPASDGTRRSHFLL